MHLIKRVILWSFTCFCLSVNAATPEQKLRTLMDDYWEAELAASPLSASLFGATTNADKIDDLSDAAFEQRKARMDVALSALKTIPVAKLSESGRINYDAFEWILTKERRTLDFDWRYMTFDTLGGWQTRFPQILLAGSYKTETDYRNLLKRLAAFGKYADQNMSLMQRGMEAGYTQPCEVLAGYETSIAGYINEDPSKTVFYMPFNQLPDRLEESVKAELQQQAQEVIAAVVTPAYQKYLNFYSQQYLPSCRKNIALGSVPRGEKLYNHFVTYFTTLETDANTVHDLGLSEVARILEEMEKIAENTGFNGDVMALREFLRTDLQFYASDKEAYMRYVARITKNIDGVIPEFFALVPRNPYGLKEVPAQIEAKATTAYYQPGAVDGTRAGQYFVNTYDLPSRPLYELPALSLHEGVPGHHLQISIQQELEDMPNLRKTYYFHAFGEGWGLYSELIGEEMGIYRDDYERFGRLIYEMWRACRLVVDTGMHAKGWSRQQAIDYMLANSGLTEQNVIAEVDRYITYPGQALAYKLGELKIRDLRKRAEDALGDEFSVREFHKAILDQGSMPLTVLDAKIDRWIKAQL